ncbi:hypothetical protein GM31_22550 [Trabulsiella odontotermitis]|uniref:Uncharacterized protein n=1 Tax=Trabulsiella odontotermitis TaxID=379893 RepID=A0A0L0GW27_9ENTR|nr:hypothetical protein GM31_22550 [Trabulsiella odontotermitis]
MPSTILFTLNIQPLIRQEYFSITASVFKKEVEHSDIRQACFFNGVDHFVVQWARFKKKANVNQQPYPKHIARGPESGSQQNSTSFLRNIYEFCVLQLSFDVV